MITGLLVGLLIGFAFTNAVNRRESDEMRHELERLRASAASAPRASEATGGANGNTDSSMPLVSDDQLRNAIARGDAAPNDLTLQRDLGRNLYLYASYTNNAEIVPDAIRFLQRAHDGNPRDYETTVLLGDAYLALARTSDPNRFEEARSFYQQALRLKPDDANAHTGTGMTYFFDRPSDPQRAISEYRKALASDARHEAALQNLAAALIATNDLIEAQKTIEHLKDVNDQNPVLSDLEAQLSQSRNAERERK
ncbi:MAG: tetratricopeptide repeat protein [Pyrinomonadaceae bacterium]|nr:tetratricopeptide repeat protein [Pyrinomonadaceae bacterium]